MSHQVEISGALTLDGASAVLQSGHVALAAAPAGEVVFDLSGVSGVDSAGLAVVFAWLREARAAGRTLNLSKIPAQLQSLAAVYGVGDLLPVL
ncbi:MAG TPA: STAS domain-containing protein [Rhodocyclaceae bacterium]|jgi:phospholipid transport system transporter-binding protein|nr:STAS domain-containing protein [Rhodocyclaceae bacterium]